MGRHLYEALHEIKCGRKTYAEGDIAEWEDDVAETMPEALRGPLNVTAEDDPSDEGAPYSEDELRAMGINDLRGAARKLEIPASGSKKDLLLRLLDVCGYAAGDEEPETGKPEDEPEKGADDDGEEDDGGATTEGQEEEPVGDDDEDEVLTVAEFLDGTVPQIEQRLESIESLEDLDAIEAAEKAAETPRKGVQDAVDARREQLKLDDENDDTNDEDEEE